MGKMLIKRRAGALGKMSNSEPLLVSVVSQEGQVVSPEANACGWEDFLFHLGPVTPRLRLHQADRDLRRAGEATLVVDDSVVDEAWIKSFLQTLD
ncbi:MAG TPA: hypothetical protein VGD59_04770 [Acidisarcina sp.]